MKNVDENTGINISSHIKITDTTNSRVLLNTSLSKDTNKTNILSRNNNGKK